MTGTADRPNILLIVVDQLADRWLDHAITPAIDRLASTGIRFGAAYSNSPLCAPARFAMLTGRPNSAIGAYDNASELPASVPTVAHLLRAGGYQTSLIGKMHFVGPDQLHGFEERLTTDIYPADFGWTPDWTDPEGRFDWWYHNLDSVTGAGVVDASNQLDYDDEVGYWAVRKLRDLARTDDERPWFLTVSFTHPHDPYLARREFWDLYDDADVPRPVVASVDEPDPHSRRLAHVIAADVTPVSAEQVQRARRAYLANTSYVDRFVGQLLDALERHGLERDTVVLFVSDHGDLLGERGLWYKMSFFEASARIPLLLRLPDGRSPLRGGSVVDTPVSLLDLAPTLLDVAGLAAEPHLGPDGPVGHSLVDIADGTERDRTVLGEYLGEGAVAPVLMIRRGSLKFVWSAPDPPQLYDLAADPEELTNLAASAPETAALTDEVVKRWDVERLHAEVVASQRARRIVDRALRQGRYQPWDHQPRADAANQFMRNHLDLNAVEASRRLD